ncbi:MAG: GerMN domain-containing protein [Defluviitaleaceae bacterium]|nr:GerMN domain-containing protein [Defluviitaleaceae bacterium]
MKKWFVSAAGLCMITLGILAFMLVSCRDSNDTDIYVYHFNPSARILEAEIQPLPVGDSIVEAVIDYMHIGPRAGNLVATWPYELAPNKSDLLQAIIVEDNMLLVFFSSVFSNMLPLEQSLFKTAFILTMETLVERAFPYIDDIKILVTDNYEYAFDNLMRSLSIAEDEEAPDVPWLIYDGSPGVYNDPLLSLALTFRMSFNYLHFVDETGTGLIIESYVTDEADRRQEERMRYALLLLIDRFQPEGAMFPIPQETVIQRVIIDGWHVFIDLSSDFVDRFEGDTGLARLTIYSIVNTLTGDFPMTMVSFMIDARQHEYFHGVENFDQPFERDDGFLLSYIHERELETWGELQ